jgi:hypothetical protein
MNTAQSNICSCIWYFSVCLLAMVLQSGDFCLQPVWLAVPAKCSNLFPVSICWCYVGWKPSDLLQSIAWTQRVTKCLLYKTEADSFVRWSTFSLSDEYIHYLINIFIIFNYAPTSVQSWLLYTRYNTLHSYSEHVAQLQPTRHTVTASTRHSVTASHRYNTSHSHWNFWTAKACRCQIPRIPRSQKWARNQTRNQMRKQMQSCIRHRTRNQSHQWLTMLTNSGESWRLHTSRRLNPPTYQWMTYIYIYIYIYIPYGPYPPTSRHGQWGRDRGTELRDRPFTVAFYGGLVATFYSSLR